MINADKTEKIDRFISEPFLLQLRILPVIISRINRNYVFIDSEQRYIFHHGISLREK